MGDELNLRERLTAFHVICAKTILAVLQMVVCPLMAKRTLAE